MKLHGSSLEGRAVGQDVGNLAVVFVVWLGESVPVTCRKCCFVFLFFLKTEQKRAECGEEKVFVDSRAARCKSTSSERTPFRPPSLCSLISSS